MQRPGRPRDRLVDTMADPTIHLATENGLLVADMTGKVLARHLDGAEIHAVLVSGGWAFAAPEGRGVLRVKLPLDAASDWEPLGLEDQRVWTLAATGGAGRALAGLEPAALCEVGGDGGPSRFVGLDSVEGHEDWHSPWGPADLCAVCVDGDRMVVGVEVGGVAVSEDAGKTWEARNHGLYEDVHCLALLGNTWAATTGMGFHITTDAGLTWSWEMEGVDRGYTQGLAVVGSSADTLVMSSASGPPPMWESGGPEAALFRLHTPQTPYLWDLVCDGFRGNVDRGGIASAGDLVVAGTSEGELLLSRDAGWEFDLVAEGMPPIIAVALAVTV